MKNFFLVQKVTFFSIASVFEDKRFISITEELKIAKKREDDLLMFGVKQKDQINTWLKDTMLYIEERKKHEKDQSKVLTLFRFLGLRHRIMHPTAGQEYEVDKRIMGQLNKAICSASCDYYMADSLGEDQLTDNLRSVKFSELLSKKYDEKAHEYKTVRGFQKSSHRSNF